MLNNLLCVDTVDHIDNNSDAHMNKVRVYFKNGHSLSIIQGEGSYGGEEGLFEIMPSDKSFLDDDDQGDTIIGHLTVERVKYYISKIGALST